MTTPAPFAEIRIPLGYAYGTAGGPADSVVVTATAMHRESRYVNAPDDPCVYTVGDRVISQAEMQTLLAFYRARRGRAQGFRFWDHCDYQANAEPLYPTGAPAIQLTCTYEPAGPNPYVRNIFKPCTGATLTRNGNPVVAGGAPGNASIDTTTGLATFVADASEGISTITAGATTVLQLAAPLAGAAVGTVVYFSGITGDAVDLINGQPLALTAVAGSSITVAVDTTGLTLAGGTAARYPQPTEALTWTGTFDVPVRFDNATFPVRFDGIDQAGTSIFYLSGLTLSEIVSPDGI
jgi:uncharacterized protein (TIGR02217 family)